MNGLGIVVATTAIIALSAFFVAVEFALMAAKRHRLEDAATTSRAARAALRSSAELTLLLAGSQLGITVCTLALGAITKPAVHHALTPLMVQVGLPATAADVVAFLLALLIVTFLHLVIGEMAPKSWAIAHPEKSAIWLALPMRAFMVPTRPILKALNESANWMVRRVGATPVDELAAGQDPDGLRHLVEHSANVGALDARYLASIEGALDMSVLTVGDLLKPGGELTAVPAGATVAEVQQATLRSGHLRVLIREKDRITGVVHVRDTLEVPDPTSPAAPYVRDVVEFEAATALHEALAIMREGRNHVAVVRRQGRQVGVVTLADLLPNLIPRRARADAEQAAAERAP